MPQLPPPDKVRTIFIAAMSLAISLFFILDEHPIPYHHDVYATASGSIVLAIIRFDL